MIVCRFFLQLDPDRIDTIPLQHEQVQRIGYIPIAITRYSKQPDAAQRFIDFLASAEGQAIFARYQYFSTADAAMQWVGSSKPIGGEYIVPDEWLSPAKNP